MRQVKAPLVSFTQVLSDYDEDTDLPSNEQLFVVRGYAIQLSGDITDYSDMGLTEQAAVTLLFVPIVIGELPPMDADLTWKGVARKVRRRTSLQLGAKVILV